jgi:glycosyltransferase involved in cell wall biosynthesis
MMDASSLRGKVILQIIPALNSGGAERTTVDIAEALGEQGARALVASDGGRLVDELKRKGGEFIPFPAATKNPLSIWQNASTLEDLCRKERVDLIHARSRAPAWSALIAARRLNIPFVTTVHGNHKSVSYLKRLYNSVMARGDAVIANSERTAQWIADHHPWAFSKIVTIPRGTDLRGFSRAAVDEARCDHLRAQWGVPEGARIMLMAARITPLKGHLVALEAFADALRQKNESLALVFVGDDKGREAFAGELDRKIITMGLKGSVYRVGHCADMPAAYALSDLVIMPSIEPEGFGRAVVEAQAMGCLVIASDRGATPGTILPLNEVGREAFTGWVVPSGDAPRLAEAMADALSLSDEARRAVAERARHHVEERFSLPVMTGATLGVYRALFAGR